MHPPTPPLRLSDSHREVLEALAKSGGSTHREVQRARALLLAGDGQPNTHIAATVGVSPSTVKAWRRRFSQDGLKAFGAVRPGRGRKPSIPAEKVAAIVAATLHEKPPGETHWSCRSMAKAQGLGHGATDLVRTQYPAAQGEDVQAVKRQAFRGEARRCRWLVFESAGEGDRPEHGRKEPDPGVGSHPGEPADEEGTRGHDDA